jgi:hypothetical protein
LNPDPSHLSVEAPLDLFKAPPFLKTRDVFEL